MAGWIEEASDAAELSHPPAWPDGITACFRGTAVTDQSPDWHVVLPPGAKDQTENVQGLSSRSGVPPGSFMHCHVLTQQDAACTS